MPSMRPRVFWEGAGIVWRRQRALWLVYFMSLFLAFLGTRGLVNRVAPAIDHSAETAPRLYHAFDLSAVAELSELPEQPLMTSNPSYMLFPLLFALFMLFVTGGILANYERNTRLSTGEFFGACGYHFWRFVRLVIYFGFACIPIAILFGIASQIDSHIDDVSVSPFSSVYFTIGAAVVILFLAMCLRLWFDMAQVIAVADDEKRMHAALRQAAGLMRRNFGSLFWLFLRISVIGTFLFGLGLYWWMIHLRPESIIRAFLLSQIMILVWIATRLWQRASETAWYGRHKAASEASTPPVPVPAPVPAMVGTN